jgi:sulfite oxidase
VRDGSAKAGGAVWVSFGEGVYDVTEFVPSHPGGNVILLAAGGSVEPFWDMYAQHREAFVYELLEEMRVGNLAADDVYKQCSADASSAGIDVAGPYAAEPQRHPALVVRSSAPFNAEPPPTLLAATQLTPQHLFYVRNHLPVPEIDPDKFRLEVVDTSDKVVASVSLEDLHHLPRHTVVATVQCAGNRRDEMSTVKAVKGGSWGIGAVSNAEWTGARLSDVFAVAGLDLANMPDARHIVFEGLDADPLTKKNYGASIPRDVFERVPDVLLAYEMNGETLSRDHGYPVRALVPGVVGARNVKWLGSVRLSANESTSHWQLNDYKGFSPSVDWDTVDFSTSPAIQELPVVSAICSHAAAPDENGRVQVTGWAWSGDGKGIVRVDVSGDGGKTWETAELLPRTPDGRATVADDAARRNRVYDWTRWRADVMAADDGSAHLVCKAVDSAYNTQPERVESIWNLRGVLNNAWHHVDVPAPAVEVDKSKRTSNLG